MQINWHEILRFGVVGIIATAIHYGIYLLCQMVMPVNVAYTIGWIVSLGCNFYLSSRYTFRRDMSAYRAGGFVGSHVVNYLMHMGLLNLFLWVGVDQVYAPLLVYGIVIPINYLLVRFVFTKLP